MPCYRCGTRQVDPDRGESPWRRGVRGDRQVLICPGCQGAFDWASDLDRCSVCASVHLVRRLGEAECRDCGCAGQPVLASGAASDDADAGDGAGSAGGATSGVVAGAGAGGDGAGGDGAVGEGAGDGAGLSLAEEVEQALSRVLGTSSHRPPYAMS